MIVLVTYGSWVVLVTENIKKATVFTAAISILVVSLMK